VISFEDTDYEAARGLLQHPSNTYVKDGVRRELAILVDRGVKAELEAVSIDMSRFADEYLPHKVFDSELVKL
jgi:DNA topoisomerase VI subunit A